MPTRVLFVAYGGGHIRTLLPVIAQLAKAEAVGGTVHPLVLALTTAKREVEAAGFDAIGFADLLDPTRDSDALAYGKQLAANFEPSTLVSQAETEAYLGASFRDLVREEGEEFAFTRWAETGRACFNPLAFAREALERLGVDMLVTTNSPRAERAFLEASWQLAIPSVVIWPTLATHEMAWVGRKPFATRICVDGCYAMQQMLNAGRAPTDIRITGNPQYDALLYGVNEEVVASFRRERGWDKTDRVLLFAQQIEPAVHPFTGAGGDPELPAILNQELIKALQQVPEQVKLCIRYHPNQVPLPLPNDPRLSVSTQQDDLALLLHAVDGVFTCSSTLGYQAGLTGIPVFQGMFSVFSADVDLPALINAEPVYDFSELPQIYLALLEKQRHNESDAIMQRSAAERVHDVILELAAEGKTP